MRSLKAGFGFIELLLVLVIIMFILFKVFNFYFKKPLADKDTQEFISQQGIATTNPKTIIDSTRNKLEDIQNKRSNEFDNIK